MAALQYADVPGYAALILRRTYADLSLPGALMDRAHEWLAGTDAKWNGQDKQWTFPSGAVLAFGYLEHENDKYRYQSSEFQFIAFDELTQFTETQYTYMFSRLRRLRDSAVPIRMRAGSNPGGIGHVWVKNRFILADKSQGRIFVPARLDDNPHIDQAEYTASLMNLDYVTRSRLLAGDWDVNDAGGLFKREWFPLIEFIPPIRRKVRYWDLAGTEPSATNPDPDYTSGLLLGEADNGKLCILDLRTARVSPRQVEALIADTAHRDGVGTIIGIEEEPGSAGKSLVEHYRTRVLPSYAVYGVRPTGDKVTRARPVSARAEQGDFVLAPGEWHHQFLDTVSAFPNAAHDDIVDTLSGAHQLLTSAGELRIGSAPEFLTGWRG